MLFSPAKLRFTMKELLLQFAKYNLRANKRIIDILLKLDDEKLDQEFVSSFSTIRKTVYHLWSAEFMWFQRLQLTENPVRIGDIFQGTFSEACDDWQKVSAAIIQFIEKEQNDRLMSHVIEFYREKKAYKNKVSDILLHSFNHATYHRGQLVTMLRQLGVTKIPGMDLITFAK